MHARIIRLAGILSEKSGSVMVEHKACIASVSVQNVLANMLKCVAHKLNNLTYPYVDFLLRGN